MDKLTQECALYFKTHAGLKKLLPLMREKVISFGEAKGKITLTMLNAQEQEDIALFLGINPAFDLPFSLSLAKLQKALDGSKFEGVGIIELLEEVYGERLIAKKVLNEQAEDMRKNYFYQFIVAYADTKAANWLKTVVDTKRDCWPTLARAYDQNQEELALCLHDIMKALNQLPLKEITRLDVFAAEINGDPHAFDDKKKAQVLLLSGIVYINNMPYKSIFSAEEKSELLYCVGLVRDDLFNFTFCLRFEAMHRHSVHDGWHAFYRRYEVMMVALHNLKNVDSIQSGERVILVENPSVFSALAEVIREQRLEHVSLLCTTGQINIATYRFLDLIDKASCKLYYCGDFDPEGLLIAQKLKNRYPQMNLWMYTEDAFAKCVSDVGVSASRIAMLDKLNDEQLLLIAKLIKSCHFCGYQEKLIDDYRADLVTAAQAELKGCINHQ